MDNVIITEAGVSKWGGLGMTFFLSANNKAV